LEEGQISHYKTRSLFEGIKRSVFCRSASNL